jgi:Transferrin
MGHCHCQQCPFDFAEPEPEHVVGRIGNVGECFGEFFTGISFKPLFSLNSHFQREIITGDNYISQNVLVLQAPAAHVAVFRAVPIENDLCATGASWCTTSPEELSKCEVIRSAGITSGVYPLIECKPPTTSTLACLSDISASRADFMGIDSNFGYLARQ